MVLSMKKRLVSFINDNKILIITGLFATLLILIILYFQEVAPLGKNGLLTIDFFHQYGPMLSEFYDRIKEGSNLIYSFDTGLGLPFYRNFFNYLSSPFNAILFLFKRDHLLIAFTVIIASKVICSALTMGYFLGKKIGKNFFLIPLSLMYAFCAYFTAYYWNIMWLDGLVFLPLIILGIENIVNYKKPLLYIISLTVMLFANYFIAYMICIFSVIYFIGYLFIKTDKFEYKIICNKILLFFISSLIAGGLMAFALLPIYFGLKTISATGDIFATTQYYLFNLKEFLFNHFSGNVSTVLKSDIANAPNIAVGVISLPLILLFIINNAISLKRKIVYLLMLFIFLISFLSGPLDFIWHAFHVPNDLPFRYSFLYSFVLIIICAYSLKHLKNISYKWVFSSYIISLILISLIYFLKIETLNKDMIILNLAVLTIFFLIYTIYKQYNGSKLFINFFLTITISLEIIISVNNNWKIDQKIDEFYADYYQTKQALNYLKEKDNNFYRFEKVLNMTLNDPAWYNYYGQSIFSSMAYENMAFLQHKLGLPGNEINSYYYKQTTPIYDLMFNIKYILGIVYNPKYYGLTYQLNNTFIYNSLYNCGFMFGVSQDIKNWEFHGDNPFYIQNNFIARSTELKQDVFKAVKIINKETVYENNNINVIRYTINNNNNDIYYYLDDSNVDFILIDSTLYYKNDNYTYIDEIDELNIFNFQTYNESYIINQINNSDSSSFYVSYNNYLNDSILVYTIDDQALNNAYQLLCEKEVNIIEFKENYINASIDLNKKSIIYTSIPFDKGWKVFVNNKQIETFELGNALLAFEIDAGSNKIELKYSTPGFKTGIIISITSLSLILIFYTLNKRKK